MLHQELGDASLSEQHFRPKQAYQNSMITYYSTKPSKIKDINKGGKRIL
ncbi:hypothetical protein [Sodalis sp. (in: enterobacteria)]